MSTARATLGSDSGNRRPRRACVDPVIGHLTYNQRDFAVRELCSGGPELRRAQPVATCGYQICEAFSAATHTTSQS